MTSNNPIPIPTPPPMANANAKPKRQRRKRSSLPSSAAQPMTNVTASPLSPSNGNSVAPLTKASKRAGKERNSKMPQSNVSALPLAPPRIAELRQPLVTPAIRRPKLPRRASSRLKTFKLVANSFLSLFKQHSQLSQKEHTQLLHHYAKVPMAERRTAMQTPGGRRTVIKTFMNAKHHTPATLLLSKVRALPPAQQRKVAHKLATLAMSAHENDPILAQGANEISEEYWENELGEDHYRPFHEVQVREANIPSTGTRPSAKLMKDFVERLAQQEIQTSEVAAKFADALVNGFEAENIGWPDEENALPSAKPKLFTHYTLPFSAAGEVAAIISDDPKDHIRVLGGAGSQTWTTPTYRNNSQGGGDEWDLSGASPSLLPAQALPAGQRRSPKITVEAPRPPLYITPPPGISGNTGTFYASVGGVYDVNDPNKEINLPVYNVNGANYSVVPMAAGDTVPIYYWTIDTTAGNYKLRANFVTGSPGTYSLTPVLSAALTGANNRVTATLIAPANCVGFYAWDIINQAVGTAPAGPTSTVANFVVSAGDVSIPVGEELGTDVAFLEDYADKYRITSIDVWAEYRGITTGNGTLVGGQFRDEGGDDIPAPSVENWSVLDGFINKDLGGIDAGLVGYLLPGDSQSNEFQVLDPEGGVPAFEKFGVLASANQTEAEFLELHTCCHFSVRSNNQFYAQTAGLSNVQAIDEALSILRAFPNVFSNGDHKQEVVGRVESVVNNTVAVEFLNGWNLDLSIPFI